ncbi:hypothetical protein LCGC14_1482710 [marine sediment metagenome]|uniref:GTP cyclohydrolase I n=1 Tax=marine sediment metagenome TaxID=412755 RepID=A0A0F9J9S1_9ZZZZ
MYEVSDAEQQKINAATHNIRSAMYELGIIQSSEETKKTPERVIKMWMASFEHIGDEYEDFHLSDNKHAYNQIIHFSNIHYVSWCAHHLLCFSGMAHVLYIPDKHLVGASKSARIVEWYSKRPQLQENLCHDIINSFVGGVKPLGAMVVLFGAHDCMRCRGVKQKDSGMTTSAVKGIFADEQDMELKGFKLIELSQR